MLTNKEKTVARATVFFHICLSCCMDEEPMTASGGYFIGSEINRNEQSALQAVATIEVADVRFPL